MDTLKIEWVDAAWGLLANDRVIMCSDYSVSSIETLGYVTAGNSRLGAGIRIL